MPSLGTRRFWKPNASTSIATSPQILKMQGYVSVVLQGVHYHSSGSFWQRVFGGSDRICLASQVSYLYGEETVTSKTIQSVSKVEARRDHFLAVARHIALQVPTDADGIELGVEINAVEEDGLAQILTTLSSDEYKRPLELAPPVVGQILAISSLVKRLFTQEGSQKRLHATYPGILSPSPHVDPVENDRLVQGHLILISRHDDDVGSFDNFTAEDLSVRADGLWHSGRRVPHTYIIFNITFDPLRGPNSRSTWYRKYQESVAKLDELYSIASSSGGDTVYQGALKLWIEASALLDADPTYIERERDAIKKERFVALRKKRAEIEGESIEATSGLMGSAIGSVMPAALAGLIPFADEPEWRVLKEAEDYSSSLGLLGIAIGEDRVQPSRALYFRASDGIESVRVRTRSFDRAVSALKDVAELMFEAESSIHSVGIGELEPGNYCYVAVRDSLLEFAPTIGVVPDSLAGFSVQIVDGIGWPIADGIVQVSAGASAPIVPEQNRHRGIVSGLQIQNFDGDDREGLVASHKMAIGTLGCFVELGGVTALLSNNHVIAVGNRGHSGDRILQPGALAFHPSELIATLTAFEPLAFSSPGSTIQSATLNIVDAAVAELVDPMACQNGYLPFRKLRGLSGTTSAAPGDIVFMIGQTSELTFGRVKATQHIARNVKNRWGLCWFEQSILIEGLGGTTFARHGDSGAAILKYPSRELVGLLYAATSTHGFACPIQDVFATLGCRLK